MSNYVNNSIFTDYALELINGNMIDDVTQFNFQRIGISNLDTVLDSSTTVASENVYLLDVTSVTYSDNVCTITTDIPEEIVDFTIRTISLYNYDGEQDNLFAYASINAVKPSDLAYSLVIDIDLELQFLNLYPTKVEITTKDYEYASQEEKEDLSDKYMNTFINIERVEDRTTKTIGYNKPEVFYNKERELAHNYDSLVSIHKFGKFQKIISSEYVQDYYVNDTEAIYSFYKLRNLVDSDSAMSVSLNKMISYKNNFHFQGTNGSTLIVNLLISDFKSSFILKKGTLNNDTNEYTLLIENSILKFRVYGTNGSYCEMQYIFTDEDIVNLSDIYNTIFIAFTNDFQKLNLTLYINDTPCDISIMYNGTPDETLVLKGAPLSNYYKDDGDNVTLSDNYIKSIIGISKYITKSEVKQIVDLTY